MANMDMSFYWALQDIKDDANSLADPFHFAVFMDYRDTFGDLEAQALLNPNMLKL